MLPFSADFNNLTVSVRLEQVSFSKTFKKKKLCDSVRKSASHIDRMQPFSAGCRALTRLEQVLIFQDLSKKKKRLVVLFEKLCEPKAGLGCVCVRERERECVCACP